MMLNGLYLCYEGFEKIYHYFFHREQQQQEKSERVKNFRNPANNPLELERTKIKGAIRTDFILSAEIIVLTLGVVAESAFITQVGVLSAIAMAMTVGVYGLVAGIVKLDDAGLYLSQLPGTGMLKTFQHWLGWRLLNFAPRLMKTLTVVGTIAMFLVGGGILAHGFHSLDLLIKQAGTAAAAIGIIGPTLNLLLPLLLHALLGAIAGALVLALLSAAGKLRALIGH
jgi:hypothetical protein